MIYINITFLDPCLCCWNFQESIKKHNKKQNTLCINDFSNTKGSTKYSWSEEEVKNFCIYFNFEYLEH